MGKSGLTQKLSPTPFDVSYRLVTSSFMSPMTLGLIRLLLGSYALLVLVIDLALEGAVEHDAQTFFSYFTHLTYIGLCAYFFAAGVQTIAFGRSLRRADPVPAYPLQSWPRFLQFLQIILYTSIVTFPFLVTIVFWVLLSSPSTFATSTNAWRNISMHALNSVFALFELLVSRNTLHWIHTPFMIILLGGYVGVAYITHATQGFYPYAFLDPSKQGAKLAAYLVGIPIGELILFFFAWGITWARDRMFPPKLNVSGVEIVTVDEEKGQRHSA